MTAKKINSRYRVIHILLTAHTVWQNVLGLKSVSLPTCNCPVTPKFNIQEKAHQVGSENTSLYCITFYLVDGTEVGLSMF